MTIRKASFPDDLDAVRRIFAGYAVSLDVDLCFQGFADELAGLPGSHARPRGGLWLALADDVVGCVALRPRAADRCEIKWLYLRPTMRGLGLGRRLAETAIAAAVDAGYERLCLDTLPTMTDATALYRSLGFRAIDPYYGNPISGTLFLELRLRPECGMAAGDVSREPRRSLRFRASRGPRSAPPPEPRSSRGSACR